MGDFVHAPQPPSSLFVLSLPPCVYFSTRRCHVTRYLRGLELGPLVSRCEGPECSRGRLSPRFWPLGFSGGASHRVHSSHSKYSVSPPRLSWMQLLYSAPLRLIQ